MGDIVWGLSAPIGKGTFVECNGRNLINPPTAIEEKLPASFENGVGENINIGRMATAASAMYHYNNLDYIAEVRINYNNSKDRNVYIHTIDGKLVNTVSFSTDSSQSYDTLSNFCAHIEDNIVFFGGTQLDSTSYGMGCAYVVVNGTSLTKGDFFNDKPSLPGTNCSMFIVGLTKYNGKYYLYVGVYYRNGGSYSIRRYESTTISGFSKNYYTEVQLGTTALNTGISAWRFVEDNNRKFIMAFYFKQASIGAEITQGTDPVFFDYELASVAQSPTIGYKGVVSIIGGRLWVIMPSFYDTSNEKIEIFTSMVNQKLVNVYSVLYDDLNPELKIVAYKLYSNKVSIVFSKGKYMIPVYRDSYSYYVLVFEFKNGNVENLHTVLSKIVNADSISNDFINDPMFALTNDRFGIAILNAYNLIKSGQNWLDDISTPSEHAYLKISD